MPEIKLTSWEKKKKKPQLPILVDLMIRDAQIGRRRRCSGEGEQKVRVSRTTEAFPLGKESAFGKEN